VFENVSISPVHFMIDRYIMSFHYYVRHDNLHTEKNVGRRTVKLEGRPI
jgi:hypothetical protein